MLRQTRAIAWLLLATAATELVLAVELVDQGASVDDRYRVFLAGWLETQLWVDIRLVMAGAVTLALGLARAVAARRERDGRSMLTTVALVFVVAVTASG